MKHRSDYITNSSSTSYIINISLICNDETQSKKILELYRKEEMLEDSNYSYKTFCGEDYEEFDYFDVFDDEYYSDDNNIIKEIEKDDVINAIISLATSSENRGGYRNREIKKLIEKYLKERNFSIFDFTDIVISKATSAHGEDYSNTGIYDVFGNLTLEEIDRNIEAVAERLNTNVESLEVYKEHLKNNLDYHTVEEIQVKGIYNKKIKEEKLIHKGFQDE